MIRRIPPAKLSGSHGNAPQAGPQGSKRAVLFIEPGAESQGPVAVKLFFDLGTGPTPGRRNSCRGAGPLSAPTREMIQSVCIGLPLPRSSFSGTVTEK